MPDVIGWDFDGTLADDKGFNPVNWHVRTSADLLASSWHPIPHNILTAKLLSRLGYRLVLISGRTKHHLPATIAQLEKLGILELFHSIEHQEQWKGEDEIPQYKAEAMRRHGVLIYFGDTPGDRIAAALAGAGFVQC